MPFCIDASLVATPLPAHLLYREWFGKLRPTHYFYHTPEIKPTSQFQCGYVPQWQLRHCLQTFYKKIGLVTDIHIAFITGK